VLLLGFNNGELPPHAREEVRSLVSDRDILVTDNRAEMEEVLDRIEIAVRHVPLEVLGNAPALKWYHHWYAGVDWLERYPDLRGRDFALTNASGVHAVSITEQVLGMILAFARSLHKDIRAQAHSIWRKPTMTDVFEVSGKRMLIVGMGAIGTHLARAASGLGVQVTGIRRHGGPAVDGVHAVLGIEHLHDQLGRADFVVIALPATADTRHMFGAREFSEMRAGSYLINIGRGSIVDEPALISALESGHLAGAGLDVFETEPLPVESPLWKMEQVIITPHTGGHTPAYFERSWPIFMENLRRYLEGRELQNLVDKGAGY
jgi:phosphoglycerate dehydrogenase-like enzyme